MKIIKLTEDGDIEHLKGEEKEKVAKLKVIGDHLYTKGIGVKDCKYFILEDTETDSEYIKTTLKFDNTYGDPLGRSLFNDIINNVNHHALDDELMGHTLVFFKYVKGRRYMFRTNWDLSPIQTSLMDS